MVRTQQVIVKVLVFLVLIPLRSGHGSDHPDPDHGWVVGSLNPFEIRAWFGLKQSSAFRMERSLNPFEIRAWFGLIMEIEKDEFYES